MVKSRVFQEHSTEHRASQIVKLSNNYHCITTQHILFALLSLLAKLTNHSTVGYAIAAKYARLRSPT